MCVTVLGVLSSTSKTEEATEIADVVDVTLVKRGRTLSGCSSVPPLCKALQIRNMDGASRAPVENDFKEFLADATTRKTSFGNSDFLAKEASCDGRLCRPWRGLQQAHIDDADGEQESMTLTVTKVGFQMIHKFLKWYISSGGRAEQSRK